MFIKSILKSINSITLTTNAFGKLFQILTIVCYAMGHAAWNKSYDDDDDYNNQHILCVDYTHQTTKILKLYT